MDSSYKEALSTPNAFGQMPIHIFFHFLSDLQNMHKLVPYPSWQQRDSLDGKQLHATDNRGCTGVHYLFDKENLVLSQRSLLKDNGGLSNIGVYISRFIYAQDCDGYTPLHLAAMKWGKNTQSLAGFQVLMEVLNPELNSPLTHAGESVLILAAKNKNRELVKYLLNLPEVDLHIEDRSGKKAVDYVADDAELLAAFRLAAIADLEKVNTRVHVCEAPFFEVFTDHVQPDSSLHQLKN